MSQGYGADYLVKATGETEITKYLTPITRSSGITAASFTIPAGVKKFDLHMMNVGSDGTQNMRIRLGDATSVKTTGYASTGWRTGSASIAAAGISSYISVERNAAGDNFDGVVSFYLADPASNTWTAQGQLADQSSGNQAHGVNGAISLDSELTTLQIDFSSDDWDGDGLFYVSYENPDLAISGNDSVPAGVTDVFINGTQVATTSGTEVDFSIPSGVKEIKVMVNGVSSTTITSMAVRLEGDSGIETTGYTTVAGYLNDGGGSTANTNQSLSASMFHFFPSIAATYTISGIATLTLMDAATNTWVCKFSGSDYAGTNVLYSSGAKTLSGELTVLRFLTTAGTFDAGSVNIQYDNQELDLGSGVISGGVVQTVNTQDGEFSSGTTVMPLDDTIPQSTEGVEFLTASITPTGVANKLRIDVILHLSHSTTSSYMLGALFQDSTASALAAAHSGSAGSAGGRTAVTFTHWMDAGTLSSTTFKVRAGNANAGTTRLNGGTTRSLGGVLASSMTITEYKA